MRSTLTILVALLAGCAPVPPGDVVGGHAEWADESAEYSGDVATCVADADGIHVTAGGNGTSLILRPGGDWTQAEWDAEDRGSYAMRPGVGIPLTGCAIHVGTGASEWIIDAECDQIAAHVVVTGCERR